MVGSYDCDGFMGQVAVLLSMSIKNEDPSSQIRRPQVPQKPMTGMQFLVELIAILDKQNKNYFRSIIQALL